MELRHLRYFIALTERLHFTQAAEKVHVTQSTLSHQIKQLEDELGHLLFERNGRNVSMTAEGMLFREYVAKAMSSIDEGVRTLRHVGDSLSGEIRVGAGQAFCGWLMPRCVQIFRAKHPDVKILIEEVSMGTLADKFNAHELDVAVSYRPEGIPGVVFEPLYNEELRLVLPSDHPWASRKRVRMVELHGEPMVLLSSKFATRGLLEQCFSSAGAEPAVVVETNSNSLMINLARDLKIATIAPEHPAVDISGLSLVSLESPTPIRTFGLVSPAEARKSVVIQAFAAVVRRVAESANAKRPKD